MGNTYRADLAKSRIVVVKSNILTKSQLKSELLFSYARGINLVSLKMISYAEKGSE
jgi:hypothetical protein